LKTQKSGNTFSTKLNKSIDKAKKFHDKLQLKAHSNTTVSGSIGKNTVLKVNITLNKDNVLDLPYTITTDGDGTVPRTSEIALLATPDIKLVKDGLIQGDIAHADIPSNATALKQVKQFLADVTVKLSKQNATP